MKRYKEEAGTTNGFEASQVANFVMGVTFSKRDSGKVAYWIGTMEKTKLCFDILNWR